MLTPTQKSYLKSKLITARKHFSSHLSDENLKDSTGSLSSYDNHPADTATSLYEREKDLGFDFFQEDVIKQINDAIMNMSNDEYGFCQTCEKPIPFERLVAIPWTKYCVKHANNHIDLESRPIEEDVTSYHFD